MPADPSEFGIPFTHSAVSGPVEDEAALWTDLENTVGVRDGNTKLDGYAFLGVADGGAFREGALLRVISAQGNVWVGKVVRWNREAFLCELQLHDGTGRGSRTYSWGLEPGSGGRVLRVSIRQLHSLGYLLPFTWVKVVAMGLLYKLLSKMFTSFNIAQRALPKPAGS